MSSCLFVTDLDGTLLSDERTLSRENFSCLASLKKKGIITAIATGRSNASFFHAITKAMDYLGEDLADFPVDYLICSTGAGIMDLSSGKILQSWSMTRQEVQQICAYFDERKTDYMVHKQIPHTIYFEYKTHGQYNPDFQTRLAFYKDEAVEMRISGPQFEHATQALAVVPESLSLEKVDQIRSALRPYSVIQTTSPFDHKSTWIEVFHPQVSKSNACQWLATYLKMSVEQITAVGNDYNDKDLLEWAGQKFLVNNAPAHLKTFFPLVASNNDHGVAQAAGLAGLL